MIVLCYTIYVNLCIYNLVFLLLIPRALMFVQLESESWGLLCCFGTSAQTYTSVLLEATLLTHFVF